MARLSASGTRFGGAWNVEPAWCFVVHTLRMNWAGISFREGVLDLRTRRWGLTFHGIRIPMRLMHSRSSNNTVETPRTQLETSDSLAESKAKAWLDERAMLLRAAKRQVMEPKNQLYASATMARYAACMSLDPEVI